MSDAGSSVKDRTLRIGVHPSVDAFDPETLCEALSDLDHAVFPIEDRHDGVDFDAAVTLEHDDRFLHPNVEWIHFISAGVDHVPLAAYEERGVAATNSSGVHGECMAENVLGLVLTLAHRLHEFRDDQRDREWNPDTAWNEKFTVTGERLTVVGLGAIGQTVAEYADRLGLTVDGVKRTPEPVDGVRRVYANEELEAAIADARFVVLAVPLSEETRHLLDAEQFERMREDAYLVNVSRGEVVRETALVDALEAGRIGGAALDVFAEEPLPGDSPLWEMDDVVVTPHVSGAFSTYHLAIAELVRENVERVAADRELLNRVA